jgi:hypothetical protein
MELSKEKKDQLTDFVKFVKSELGLKTLPKIKLLNGRGKLKTTANYNYSDKKKVVKINSKNRAFIDILRSLAHELTHHKQ